MFANNASALKTRNGYLINFHGFCFFVTDDFVYQVWSQTLRTGKFPPTQEYGRLRKLELPERKLNDEEEKLAGDIAKNLAGNPHWGLDPEDEKTLKQNLRILLARPKLGAHEGLQQLKTRFA
jgi:hypothetical protein